MTIYILTLVLLNVCLVPIFGRGDCEWSLNDDSDFACSTSPTYRMNAQRNGRSESLAPYSKPRLYKATLHVSKGYHLNSRTAPTFSNNGLTELSTFETCLFNDCLNIIHASGDSNWTYFSEDISSTPITPGHLSISSNDRAYIVTERGSSFSLISLHIHDEPTEIWRYNFPNSTSVSKSVLILKNDVVIMGVDNYLVSLDNKGKLIWRHDFNSSYVVRNTALGLNHVIYVGLSSSSEHRSTGLAAISLNGTLIWDIKLDDASEGGDSPVVGENGLIYYTSENTFFAINDTGAIVWSKDNIKLTKILPAIAHNGNVIILNAEGTLTSLNGTTGETIQKKKINRSICYSPVVDRLDHVLVVTGGCNLNDRHNATLSYFDSDLNTLWETSTVDGFTDNPQSNSHAIILSDGSLQLSSGAYYYSSPLVHIKHSHGSVQINSELYPLVLTDNKYTCAYVDVNPLAEYNPTKLSSTIYYYDMVARKQIGKFDTTNCSIIADGTLFKCCLSDEEVVEKLKHVNSVAMNMKMNISLKNYPNRDHTLNGKFFSTFGITGVSKDLVKRGDPIFVNITGFNLNVSKMIYCKYVYSHNSSITPIILNGVVLNGVSASCSLPTSVDGKFCLEISNNRDHFTNSCVAKLTIRTTDIATMTSMQVILIVLLVILLSIIAFGTLHYLFCHKNLKDELDLLEIDNRIEEDFNVDNYDQILLSDEKELDFL